MLRCILAILFTYLPWLDACLQTEFLSSEKIFSDSLYHILILKKNVAVRFKPVVFAFVFIFVDHETYILKARL